MIRVYKRSEWEPLLRVVIEDGEERGSEEVVFTNRRGTKRYRLLISPTGVCLDLVSSPAGQQRRAKEKAA